MAKISRRDLLRRGALAGAGLVAAAGLPSPALAGPRQRTEDGTLQLARVWPGRSGLPEGLDHTHRIFDDGSVEVLLWPGDLERVRAAGARVVIAESDVVARGRAAAASMSVRTPGLEPQPGERNAYRRLAEIESDMRKLAQDHQDRARLFELPFTTFEGRRVLCLEIASDVHGVDGRPTFHMDGVHHAREWPAAEMSIMWAYDLLESYGKDPRITAIVDNVRTTVVPVVNPDGFNHSRETAAGQGQEAVVLGGRGQYWRKNRRSLTDYFAGEGLGVAEGPTGSQYPEQVRGSDAYGVDPNRNYAYTWGRPGSSSSDIHSQAHRGDSPLSEPESRNITWLMTTRHITGAITHHTYANEVIWPWANEMGDVPDGDLYSALGGAMAGYAGYNARKYNTSEGTTPDAFYGAVSSICFLIEHGGGEFHPAYASFIPLTYSRNRDAFLLATEELAILPELRAPIPSLPDGLTGPGGGRVLHHSVLRGRAVNGSGAGVPAELVTRKRFQSPLWLFGDGTAPGGRKEHEEIFEARIRTAPNGRFEWHLNPSTRPHIQRDGGVETYELSVLSAAGGTARTVALARGEVVDLGDVQVV